MEKFKEPVANFFLIFGVILCLYIFWIRDEIFYKKAFKGVYLYEDGIHKKNFFGGEVIIPYEKIESQIRSGAMEYSDTGIEVGKGSSKLSFPYEIGRKRTQNRIQKCLTQLQNHVQVKLLPYEETLLEHFDKRYYYNRKRKRHLRWLCVALFLTACGLPNMAVSGQIAVAVILCLWECISLFCLFKNAIYTKINTQGLVTALAKFPEVCDRMVSEFQGYFWFAVAAIGVISVNLWVIIRL